MLGLRALKYQPLHMADFSPLGRLPGLRGMVLPPHSGAESTHVNAFSWNRLELQ